MLIFGLGLSVLAVGFFCWLVFTAAVYALPFAAGLTAGMAAAQHGVGAMGALTVAFVVGVAVLMAGRLAIARTQNPTLRSGVAFLYAAPAAYAAYSAVLQLAQFGGGSFIWSSVCAVFGSLAVGVAAWSRLSGSTPVNLGSR